MINIDKYQKLLGVNQNASPQEIKQAYLTKVKEPHANYQLSIEAQEQFLALTEAYEVVSGKMQKKLKSKSFDYETWKNNIKYKTEYYSKLSLQLFSKYIYDDLVYEATIIIGNHVGFILCNLLLVVVTVFAVLYQMSLFGLLLYGLGYIIYELWKELDMKRFMHSCLIIFQTKVFRTMLTSFIIVSGIIGLQIHKCKPISTF